MNKETIHLIKGYLGYGVECEVRNDYEPDEELYFEASLDTLFLDSVIYEMDFKLKLRSIEDLTDKEIKQLWYEMPCYVDCMIYDKKRTLSKLYGHIQNLDYRTMEYLNSIHIDYFGLIGQGLAIKKEVE